MAREGKAKVLTEAEFKRLLIVAKNSPMSTRNVAMIFCSFGLGLRSKEISSLSIKDIADSSFKLLDEINLKRNMTKGEKQRAVQWHYLKPRHALRSIYHVFSLIWFLQFFVVSASFEMASIAA